MMEKHLEIGSLPSNSLPGPEMAKLEGELGGEKVAPGLSQIRPRWFMNSVVM